MSSELPLLQCSLRYISVYLLLAVFFGAVQVIFDLNLGVMATASTLAGATCYVAFWVVRRRQLPLAAMQAFNLALCSMLTTFLVALLIVGAVLLREEVRAFLALLDRGALVHAGVVMLVYSVFVFFLQWALYYFFARLYYRGLQKSGRLNVSPEAGEQQ